MEKGTAIQLTPVEEVPKNDELKKLERTHKVHIYGFWFLIFFLFGSFFGMFAINRYYERKLDEGKKVGAILIQNEVYEFKKR